MKLSEIADRISCKVVADFDPEIFRVAGIEEAGPGDLTFVANRKYIRHIKTTRASAIILGEDLPPVAIPSLRTSNPYLAFAKALELFFDPIEAPQGIHASAVIAPDAVIGADARIGPCVVIGEGCTLGKGVILYPHAVLYPNVQLGEGAVLHAHAVVREHCRIGARVVLQNGVVIGSDGFGFAPREDGSYCKIVQTGRVIIEDDVEIGANTTIDRAAVGDTIIRRGAKLDNLVQIGHGAQVGENCVLAAQVGLAGSTRLGRNVRVGGQAGFAGHLEVGDNAVVTAQSGTSHDVDPGAIVSGSPAMDNAAWLRSVVALPKLHDLIRKVRDLEKELARLQKRVEISQND
jgi:UDP-3-O-[3-hydroxymyristoyl] glucosamine N-acyltransferase